MFVDDTVKPETKMEQVGPMESTGCRQERNNIPVSANRAVEWQTGELILSGFVSDFQEESERFANYTRYFIFNSESFPCRTSFLPTGRHEV